MKMNLPGLHGGISQQTPNLRLPNQHTDATNVIFDVVDGVKTRWPLKRLGATSLILTGYRCIGTIKTTDDITWMVYHIKGTADYTLVLVPDDTTVTAVTLTGGTTGYAFEASDKLKLYAILDTLLLLNSNKTVSVKEMTEVNSNRATSPIGIIYCPKVYTDNKVSWKIAITTTKATTKLPTIVAVDAAQTVGTYTGVAGDTPDTLYTDIQTGYRGFKYPHSDIRVDPGHAVVSIRSAMVNHGSRLYSCLVSNLNSEPTALNTNWSDVGAADAALYSSWSAVVPYYTHTDLEAAGTVITLTNVYSDFDIRYYSAIVAESPVSSIAPPRFVAVSNSFEDLPPALSLLVGPILIFQLSPGYYVYYNNTTNAYEETSLVGHRYYLDKTTMPVEITYNSSTHAWTLASVAAYETNGRLIGDSNSAPLPSFVGRKLNAMFFYRNRMCFLSENRVVMSRVGGYYNFFPETATEVLDSDPIDVFPAYKDYSPLLWAIPYSKNLVLIGPEKQYVLHSGFEALTPKTVAIDEATSYKVLPQIEPLMLETSILLWLDQGAYAGLLEYRLSEQEIATEGALLTDNVPRLIPSTITNSVYLQSEHMVIAYAQGAEIAYVYKYHKNEGGQRMQSAWTKFTWENLGIIQCLVASNESTLLLQAGTLLFQMKTDVDLLAIPSMDITSEATVSGGETISIDCIVVSKASGKELLLDSTNKVETLDAATAVWIGYPIDWNLELSPLILRDDNGLPRSDVKSTIKNVQVDWTGGDFQIKTSGDGLPTRVTDVIPVSYESHLITPGASVSEVNPTRALVMAPSKRVKLELISSGFNHVKIHNVSYNLELRKDKG